MLADLSLLFSQNVTTARLRSHLRSALLHLASIRTFSRAFSKYRPSGESTRYLAAAAAADRFSRSILG
jgi:hypothetical protein